MLGRFSCFSLRCIKKIVCCLELKNKLGIKYTRIVLTTFLFYDIKTFFQKSIISEFKFLFKWKAGSAYFYS